MKFWRFEHLDLGFVSDFDIRISNFKYPNKQYRM
jgi:hypothetical protein